MVKRPPRVKGYPFVGSTVQLSRRPWEFLAEQYSALGPIYEVVLMGQRGTVLAGPDVCEMFSDAGDNFLDRAFFYQPLQDELEAKELIFRTTGARHRELRRLASLAFSRHIAAEHVPALATEILGYFQHLVPGRSYDALAMTGDALVRASGPMLGACDLQPILRDAREYTMTMMRVAARTQIRLATWSPRYRRAKRVVRQFVGELLRAWRSGEIPNGSATYIIGCFADARDRQGNRLPDDDIIALVALLFVGVGVYVNRVVAFMLYELLRDETLRQRVIAEVDRGFANGMSYAALCEMDLLRAVYSESLRRYPIWAIIPFRSEQDFEFAGKQVCRGDLLLISPVQEHFLPQFYPDPYRFDPERCLPPRNEHMRHGAFSPFGVGGRRCIATGQTEILSLLYVALLLYRTRFRADARYELRIKPDPLAGPYRFNLRFEGMRDPGVARAASPGLTRSAAETLDRVSERLVWEETQAFSAVVDREVSVRVFPEGHEVFRQGDASDALYVIESGEAVVSRTSGSDGPEPRHETLATLGPGDMFGELGLLRRQPRSATVTVAAGTEQLVTVTCSADAFERLLGELNIVGDELIGLIRRRKVGASLARLLPSLDQSQIRDLVSDVQFKQGRRGDMFVRQGEPADAFFIIERGSFEVVLEVSPGAERTLARLKKGEFFGEVGLVHGAPRMATVRVASNCDEAQTLVVSKEAFLRLVEPASRTRERVFRTLAQRMAANRG